MYQQMKGRKAWIVSRTEEMDMRSEVRHLIDLGVFPAEEAATGEQVMSTEILLSAIQRPVTDQEAVELVKLFGPDSLFGLAWTLLRLVETAPSWPIWTCLPEHSSNDWVRLLRHRARQFAR